MRAAALAERTSWTIAGASSAVPSKEARGVRTSTASMTGATSPPFVEGMPMRRAATTAAPIAARSIPAASAARRAARFEAATSRDSLPAIAERRSSMRPATWSSDAPSTRERVWAASCVRASVVSIWAILAAREESRGAKAPEIKRLRARMSPLVGETSPMPMTVPSATTAATITGRKVLTTRSPTSSTSRPVRASRSPRLIEVSVSIRCIERIR